jgi:hypothetical protein
MKNQLASVFHSWVHWTSYDNFLPLFHNIRHFIFSFLAFEKLYKEIITTLVTLSKYAKDPKVHQGVQ